MYVLGSSTNSLPTMQITKLFSPVFAYFVCVELAFELAMSFIGFDYGSISGRSREFMHSVHNLANAITAVPINFGKYSAFGRGLQGRATLLGAPFQREQ